MLVILIPISTYVPKAHGTITGVAPPTSPGVDWIIDQNTTVTGETIQLPENSSIIVKPTINFTVVDSVIKFNLTNYGVAGLRAEQNASGGAVLKLVNSKFTNSTKYTYYFESWGDLYMDNVTIEWVSNSTTYKSGNGYVYSAGVMIVGNMTTRDIKILNSKFMGHGTNDHWLIALVNDTGTVVFENCTFDFSKGGEGIDTTAGSPQYLLFKNCTFLYGERQLHIWSIKARVEDSEFAYGTHPEFCGKYWEIVNSKFHNMTSAGLTLYSGGGVVDSSYIYNCTDTNVPGIDIGGGKPENVIIKNTLIENCYNGIYSHYAGSNYTLINITTASITEYGLYVKDSKDFKVINSEITADGKALYLDGGASGYFLNTTFKYGVKTSSSWTGTWKIYYNSTVAGENVVLNVPWNGYMGIKSWSLGSGVVNFTLGTSARLTEGKMGYSPSTRCATISPYMSSYGIWSAFFPDAGVSMYTDARVVNVEGRGKNIMFTLVNSTLYYYQGYIKINASLVGYPTYILHMNYTEAIYNKTTKLLTLPVIDGSPIIISWEDFSGIKVKEVSNANCTSVRFAYNSLTLNLSASPNTLTETVISIPPTMSIPKYVKIYDGIYVHPLSSKSEFDKANYNCWYYDSQNHLLYVKAIAHSDIPITVSWVAPPEAVGGLPSTQPSQPSNVSKSYTEYIPSFPITQVLLFILILIVLLVLWIYRCSIPLLSRTCKR